MVYPIGKGRMSAVEIIHDRHKWIPKGQLWHIWHPTAGFQHTVDGRNSAPIDRCFIPFLFKLVFQPSVGWCRVSSIHGISTIFWILGWWCSAFAATAFSNRMMVQWIGGDVVGNVSSGPKDPKDTT